jgi:hypothetical protein
VAHILANKWRLGPTDFTIPPPPFDISAAGDSFFQPLGCTLDPAVGRETVLILYDDTPFLQQLTALHTPTLNVRTGVGRNEFGPLAFFLFWFPNPARPHEHLVAYDVYLNPENPSMVNDWRRLASQTHWHVLLADSSWTSKGFFEFENTYGLSDALDFIQEACSKVPMVDFNRAKAQFMREYSIPDMFKMA